MPVHKPDSHTIESVKKITKELSKLDPRSETIYLLRVSGKSIGEISTIIGILEKSKVKKMFFITHSRLHYSYVVKPELLFELAKMGDFPEFSLSPEWDNLNIDPVPVANLLLKSMDLQKKVKTMEWRYGRWIQMQEKCSMRSKINKARRIIREHLVDVSCMYETLKTLEGRPVSHRTFHKLLKTINVVEPDRFKGIITIRPAVFRLLLFQLDGISTFRCMSSPTIPRIQDCYVMYTSKQEKTDEIIIGEGKKTELASLQPTLRDIHDALIKAKDQIDLNSTKIAKEAIINASSATNKFFGIR